jgi:hypothetical protein
MRPFLLFLALASLATLLVAIRDPVAPREVTLSPEDFRNQNQLVNETQIVLEETLALPTNEQNAEELEISELQLRLNTVRLSVPSPLTETHLRSNITILI